MTFSGVAATQTTCEAASNPLRLEVQIGSTNRDFRCSGDPLALSISFSYVVQSGDVDTDGISIASAALPMPTFTHQAVLLALYRLFHGHLAPRGGVVTVSPLRMRIRAGKFREPDLLLLRDRSDARCRDRYWEGADLVVEVVGPDDPDRDLIEKRADYAEAGIPEYWIVDPRHAAITVLALGGGAYAEHGAWGRGAAAASRLLEGFAVDVASVFDAPQPDA